MGNGVNRAKVNIPYFRFVSRNTFAKKRGETSRGNPRVKLNGTLRNALECKNSLLYRN